MQPLAVFTPDSLLLESTVEDTIRSNSMIRSAAWARGAVRARCEILEITGDLTQRFPVRLIWHYEAENGEDVASSELIYYCGSRPDGALVIELPEIVRLGFPEVITFLLAPDTEH